MGGANCEPPMGLELIRGVDAIDHVFSGPALRSFPEWVGRRLDGDAAGQAAIKGVLSRSTLAQGEREEMGEELPIDTEVGLDYSDFLASLERSFPGRGEVPLQEALGIALGKGQPGRKRAVDARGGELGHAAPTRDDGHHAQGKAGVHHVRGGAHRVEDLERPGVQLRGARGAAPSRVPVGDAAADSLSGQPQGQGQAHGARADDQDVSVHALEPMASRYLP